MARSFPPANLRENMLSKSSSRRRSSGRIPLLAGWWIDLCFFWHTRNKGPWVVVLILGAMVTMLVGATHLLESNRVDARELTESQRRAGRVVGVLISVRSNGGAPTPVKQSDASLEFIQHQHWKFSSWDPETLADHIQHQTDDLMTQTDKDLEHRPEKVEKNEERLRQHQKLVSEMLDFLSTKALKDTTLDPATPETWGWIFFPSRGKWVGGWKKREEFVFRIPVGSWIVEFPFQLPPEGRRTLKERPE